VTQTSSHILTNSSFIIRDVKFLGILNHGKKWGRSWENMRRKQENWEKTNI
jgi:hypothetical protein